MTGAHDREEWSVISHHGPGFIPKGRRHRFTRAEADAHAAELNLAVKDPNYYGVTHNPPAPAPSTESDIRAWATKMVADTRPDEPVHAIGQTVLGLLERLEAARSEVAVLGTRLVDRREMSPAERALYTEHGQRPWETLATCCDPVFIRRAPDGRRLSTTITLSEYHRTNLLWLMCDVAGYDRPRAVVTGLQTGDWSGEIPNALRIDEQGKYEEPTLRPNAGDRVAVPDGLKKLIETVRRADHAEEQLREAKRIAQDLITWASTVGDAPAGAVIDAKARLARLK